jgi:GMP synthase (glutamine-hydrolysing)
MRVLLVSLRDPHDPMASHEGWCFSTRCDLPEGALRVHPMVEGRPDLTGYDAVLFGGSGAYSVLDDVVWIREGLQVLLETVDRRIPAWASCFGFQGLSLALGGVVQRDAARTELGAFELDLTEAGRADPVFGLLPPRFWAQEGHQDHVDVLPSGVTLLATSDGPSPNQALKVNDAPFWASQFHPELTAATTLDRFRHYADRYAAPDTHSARIEAISRGQDTPELRELLRRIVRMGRETWV